MRSEPRSARTPVWPLSLSLAATNKIDVSFSSSGYLDVFETPWLRRLLELKDIEELDRDIIVEMIDQITVYENRKLKISYNFGNELEHLFSSVYCEDLEKKAI